MSAITSLTKFLKERKSKDNDHTHVLTGSPYGSYTINRDIKRFWNLYMKCVECECDVLYVAEAPIEEIPILVDIDLMVRKSSLDQDLFKRTRKIYTQLHVQEIVTAYQNTLKTIVRNITNRSDALTCLLLEKEYYEKELNGEIYIKNGFHLHFPKLFLDRKAQEVYLIPIVQEKLKDLFKEIGCMDPIDAHSVNVHWLLYGSTKPGHKPYKVTECFMDRCRKVDIENALRDYKIPSHGETDDDFLTCGDYVYELMPRILSIFLADREEYYFSPKESVNTPIISKYERLKECRNKYAQLTVDEALSEASTLLDMMSDSRADNRADWLQIGCCLWNITQGDTDGFSLWLEFSERSPKFDEAGCIYTWNSIRESKYTIGTLMFFAKQDNPDIYSQHVRTKSNNLLKETILNGGHNDFARLLFNEYETEFVCTSITSKVWYQFSQNIWKEDEMGTHLRERISAPNGIILQKLKSTICAIGDKMADEDTESIKDMQQNLKKAGDLIRGCKSAPTKDNIMKEAREVFYNTKFYEMLNKDPNLIAFKNGVYDFGHMMFRPGKPEDYLSNQMPIDYIDFGSTQNPKVIPVLDFFRKVFPNNAIRDYFLDQICQVFVGGNYDKVVLFWTGIGNNGKTVTQTLFEKMLGKFAIKFNTTVVTGKKQQNGSANPEMARAGGGVRWAVMEEPNPDEVINAGSLKWLTGNDTYWARDLYESGKKTKEITPLFKLHIICNKLPQIKDADEAVRNRVRVIPFESRFVPLHDSPESVDEQLAQKIFPMDKDFSSKIPFMVEPLAWFLIDRFKKLPKGHRVAPPEVMVATDAYMRDNDIFNQFESQAVFSKEDAKLRPSVLYEKFKKWFSEECPGQCIPNKSTVINYFNNKWGAVEKYWMNKTCDIIDSDDEYDSDDDYD